MWFCKTPQDSVNDLTEIGPRFQSRLATFQLDRAILDEHLLKEACGFGCELMRPATIKTITLSEDKAPHTLEIMPQEGQMRTVTTKWIIDASGKAAVLAKKLGIQHSIGDEHPTSSVWCRFRNVNDLDSFKSRKMFPKLTERSLASAPRPRITSWAAAGGAGSFRCRMAATVPASPGTAGCTRCQKDRPSSHGCRRIW
jgi:flavin-dependent dehydrogenase